MLYYRARWYDPQVGRFISEDPIGLAGGINWYSYVRNNPINRRDPHGLYESDVHYFLTYYLASHSGCFFRAEARAIAAADQYVDENPATMPGFGGNVPVLDPHPDYQQQQRNIDYHGLHEGSHQPYLGMHWANATSGSNGNLGGMGIYLHYLQDTFSHRGFTDPLYGHSPLHSGNHADDKTDTDVGKTVEMARATLDALKRFAFAIGRECACQEDVSWKRVQEFAAAPAGNTITRRTHSIEDVNPWYLNNKIGILGVSR
jgi:hypothetical protein